MPFPISLWNVGAVNAIGGSLTLSGGTLDATAATIANPFVIPVGTATAVSIVPTGANTTVAIVPTGTGAFTLDVPDNGINGGNVRGTGAVDLQMSRAAATQVASGTGAVAAGVSNTASNTHAVALGNLNIVSGTTAVAIGASNTVSVTGGIALGAANTVSGSNFGFAAGTLNAVSGLGAVGLGGTLAMSGNYSFGFGDRATDRGNRSAFILSPASAGGVGRYQDESYILWDTTSGATARRLLADGATATAVGVAALSNNTVQLFEIDMVVFNTATLEYSTWRLASGAIRRGVNAAATVIATGTSAFVAGPGSTTPPTLAANPTLTADTTNGGYNISYTPPVGNVQAFRAIARIRAITAAL